MCPQLPRAQYWCERRAGKCNLASLQRTALTYRQMQEARAHWNALWCYRRFFAPPPSQMQALKYIAQVCFNQPGLWLNCTYCTVSRARCRSGAPSSLGVTIAMACHTRDCELKATNKGPPLSVKKNLEILFFTLILTGGRLHQVLVNICRVQQKQKPLLGSWYFLTQCNETLNNLGSIPSI